jgi:hypothetical protein
MYCLQLMEPKISAGVLQYWRLRLELKILRLVWGILYEVTFVRRLIRHSWLPWMNAW